MNDPDHQDDVDDQDDGVQQRVVSAGAAAHPPTTAASSVFNWRGAGAAPAPALDSDSERSPESPPPPTTTEDETMVTKKKGAARARKSKQGNPQRLVCGALLQHGELSREAIAEALTELTSAQISSALNNAKSHKRVAWAESKQTYSLTAAGKEWLGAADPAAAQEPAASKTRGGRKTTAHRRGRAAAKEANLDTSPPTNEVEEEVSDFRCAVLSDGCFFISKDGAVIELTVKEHRQMLAYQERMAEAA